MNTEIVRSALARSFWSGFFACTFFHMFYQDLIGKEEYMRLVEMQWAELHWLVGFGLTVLCAWYYGRLRVKVCGRDPLP